MERIVIAAPQFAQAGGWVLDTQFVPNKGMPDLDRISKGTPLHLTGRLRTNRYTSADGTEKMYYEVFACRIRRLDEENDEIQ